MKKTSLLRSLLGAPLGLAVGFAITIIVSLVKGDGIYYPVVPALEAAMGSELKAVVVQAVVLMLYGAIWAGSSVIWELDGWSILRQSLTHLLITSLATLPVAYFMHWMDHSLMGFVKYFGIFLLIYLVIWLSQYSSMKKRISELNAKVREKNQ